MQIVEKELGELRPYENNPRKNEAAVEYVANSISEFGFKVPIVVDKDGVIVAGHTRYLAAKQLGLETVPTIVADDLTPEQVKAYRLADNKVAEIAVWDFGMLEDELSQLDIDMADFGFNEPMSFIDDLMNEAIGDVEYRGEAKEFSVTFTIDKEYEEQVLGYIKENGKELLVDLIIAETEQWNS